MTLFHLLNKNNKLKLPEARHLDEVGQTNDPKYCLFHRMVHHPTYRCNVLKDKIQALIEAGVFTLKSEHKKATPNSYPEREYEGSQLYFPGSYPING